MNATEQKLFHALKLQRDELRKTLENLCDRFSHGVHNHMLSEDCPRRPGTGEKKCAKGKSRQDVIWSLGFFCAACDGCAKQCQLSFEEKEVFEAYHKANKICGKPDAEIPSIAPSDFAKFDPKRTYAASPRWIARELYRFAVGYWCYSDRSNKAVAKAWERALDDTLAIALSTYWKCGREFIEVQNLIQKLDQEPKEKRKEHSATLSAFIEARPTLKRFFTSLDGALQKEVKSAKDIRTVILHMFTLRIEYQSGRDYPGGDLDVYDGAFCGIIDDCLKVAGLYNDKRPASYDFEDKAEYERQALEFSVTQKERCYAFLAEREPLKVTK